MTWQAVGPGRRLAGRYLVEDLLGETAGVRAWRAVDEILHRPVFVQTLPTGDPRSGPLETAARAVSRVEDPRFLRVLDVAEEDGTTFVVREWLAGVNLADLLAGGPLHAEQAAALTREAAAALAAAHERGLAHRRLDPTSVLIAPDGSLKLAGLGTDAVLRGPGPAYAAPVPSPGGGEPGGTGEQPTAVPAGVDRPPARPEDDDPAADDAVGLGRVLYATLTGKWPGGPLASLPAAPVVDGRVASPRQVRPGVPRRLDDIAARALGSAARHHHGEPLRSPAAVAAALGAVTPGQHADALRGMGGHAAAPALARHPALLEAAAVDEDPAPEGTGRMLPVTELDRPPRRGGPPRRLTRAVGFVAALLLLSGATLLGLQLLLGSLGPRAGEDPSGPGTSPGAGGSPEPSPAANQASLPIAGTTDYDPDGDGSENPASAAAAIDGDPETAWETSTYFDPMEALKPGVGLVLDLAEPAEVRGVRLTLVNEPSDVEIRVAPADTGATPTSSSEWTTVAGEEGVGTEVELTFEDPSTTRYVLVWFTRLPPQGGDFRGGIAEAEVFG